MPIAWQGYGSARGSNWNMRQWYEETGQTNDIEVVVYTDAAGYASVPWRLGRAQCSGSETSPAMRASIQGVANKLVDFSASYSPYEQRDHWPQPFLKSLELVDPAISSNDGLLYQITIRATFEDPLGSLGNRDYCANPHISLTSPVGNSYGSKFELSAFIDTVEHTVGWSFGTDPAGEFDVFTQIYVVSRPVYVRNNTLITIE